MGDRLMGLFGAWYLLCGAVAFVGHIFDMPLLTLGMPLAIGSAFILGIIFCIGAVLGKWKL